MTTLTEAVARACCAGDYKNPDDEIDGACDGPCPPMWHAYTNQARAAIAALEAAGWGPREDARQDMTEDIAKHLTKWLGYSWDGLFEGRVTDKGLPVFYHSSQGWGFQGHKGDMRDLADAIRALMTAPPPARPTPASDQTPDA